MRSSVFLILTLFVLTGCGPTYRVTRPEPGTLAPLSSSPYPAVKAAIDAMLPDSLFPPSNVGIMIVSLSKHDTLYQLNHRMLFNPASNQKLFTSATALSVLGEEYQLSTIVSVDTSAQRVYLKGLGDPLFSPADLDSLSGTMALSLPKDKEWVISADASYFDDLYWGAGWPWDDEQSAYAMAITPLILNNNAIEVRALPGNKPGEPVSVITSPLTDYVTIENHGITVADSARNPLVISRKWRERSNAITVEGELAHGKSGTSTKLSVWQPEKYAATAFAERLKALGFRVSGIVLDTVSRTAFEVTRYSHRLDSAVTFMNKVSDNLAGEALLKVLGAEKRGLPGSAARGRDVVNEFLAASAIDTSSLIVADGSGLSRYNLTSPSAVIRLLTVMYDSTKHFDAFYRSLPIAGVDGTIARRMRGSTAEGNLHAKTGTMTSESALSGYVHTAEGELLAFSIFMQNYPVSSRSYRLVQDRIGIFLSGLRRSQF